jgi:hypothetical protein
MSTARHWSRPGILLALGLLAALLTAFPTLSASAAGRLAAATATATDGGIYTYDRGQQLSAATYAAKVEPRSTSPEPLTSAGTIPVPSRSASATGVAAEAGAGGAAKAEQYVYRVHGGDSGPMGHSWTPANPMGMSNPRAELGLPKGNSGQMLTRARVTDMEGVMQRDALPLDGNPGGAPEWLFPDPLSQLEVHWTIPLVPPW